MDPRLKQVLLTGTVLAGGGVIGTAVGGNSALAGVACTPITDNSRHVTTTNCTELITIHSTAMGGFSTTSSNPSHKSNYDGSDDQLVGIHNDSGKPITGIGLSGSGRGGGIFGFDGDGGCATPRFTWVSGCPFDSTGYAGPNNTFTGINGAKTAGNVQFITPLATHSGFAEFTLEAPAGTVNVTAINPPGVPEPTSMALLGVGLAGLGLARRRKRIGA